LLVASFSVLVGSQNVFAVAPASITVTGTIRDFHQSPPGTNPDFEGPIGGLQTGQVSSILGGDDNPVFVNPPKPGFHSAAFFDEWYNDAPSNSPGSCTLTLNKISDSPPTYEFEDTTFFPINSASPECESGSLFGDEGNSNNYHFTLEIHTQFTYNAGTGQTLLVSDSDDDLFYFINDKLVVDLGGVHPAASAPAVNLDTQAVALGLVDGQTYPMDIFFAERHKTDSHFHFTTFLIEDVNQQSVAGELLPLNTTSLFISGLLTNGFWILPVMAGIAGAGVYFIRTRTHEEN